MNARASVSLHLHAEGEAARAVPIRDGSGCNLWLGSICVTASTAAQFCELAAAALEAAVIQEAADARKRAPHAFVETPALRCLGDGEPCGLCGTRKRDHGELEDT